MAFTPPRAGPPVRPHNAVLSATWSSGGSAYEEVSRGIADAIEHCINRLMPQPGERVLDVASGTGWTARRIAERGVSVTAMDFALELVKAGRELAAARNLEITFEQADAEALPYPDASFDAVISTSGVMFVQKPDDAARELARVCRSGGRLVLATWTPDGNVFEAFKVINAFVPEPVGAPPPSPFEWGNPERVRELLADDFELEFEKGMSFYREPDGQGAWETYSNGFGLLHALVEKLDKTTRERLKQELVAFYNGFNSELGICVPRDYWVIKGTRR